MAKKTLRKVCALTAMSLTVLMMVGSVGASYASSVEDLLVDVLNTAIKEAAKSSPQRKSETSPKKTKSSTHKSKTNASSIEAATEKLDELGNSLRDLAKKIVVDNKPAFEAKLTRKEREYDEYGDGESISLAEITVSRVWAKGETIVTGHGYPNDRRFYENSISTTDSSLIFAGGIHVGARVETLEKFLGVSFP